MGVRPLTEDGHTISDEDYQAAEALLIVSSAEPHRRGEMIVKVKEPLAGE